MTEQLQNVIIVHLMSWDKVQTEQDAKAWLQKHLFKGKNDGSMTKAMKDREATILALMREHEQRNNAETEGVISTVAAGIMERKAKGAMKRGTRIVLPYWVAFTLMQVGMSLAANKLKG